MYKDDLVDLLRSQHDNFDDAANVHAFDRDDDEDDDGETPDGMESASKLAIMKSRFRKHAEVSEDFEYCEEKFVDLGKFPARFTSEDEALQAYNSIGLSHRIQFKKF